MEDIGQIGGGQWTDWLKTLVGLVEATNQVVIEH